MVWLWYDLGGIALEPRIAILTSEHGEWEDLGSPLPANIKYADNQT